MSMSQAISASQLEIALRHHERGEFDKAESLYKQAMDSQPDNAEATHCAGVLALQQGRYRIATERLNRSVELGVHVAGTYFLLGRAHKGSGDIDTAIESYRQAVALDPTLADAYVSLGIALRQKNQFAEAQDAYEHALRLKPASFEARLNLANILQLRGMHDQALREYVRAEELTRESAELNYNAAKSLKALNRNDEAIERLYRAVSLDNKYLDAYYNLGNALTQAKQHPEALECYQLLMSLLNANVGRPQEGPLREKLCIDAKAGLAATLIWNHRYEEAAHLLNELLEAGDSTPLLEHLLVIVPFRFQQQARVLDVYERYQRLAPMQYVPSLQPPVRDLTDRKLKMAYLSGDFRDHSVAFFLEPILAHHNKDEFAIVCYSSNPKDDAVTERLKRYADEWVEAGELSDFDLAQRIAEDQIDILIDLSGRTTGNRVGALAHHPATLQMNYLGYPTFTGLTQIECRLTDATIDPPTLEDDSDLAAERPLRLAGSMFCYRPSSEAPELMERVQRTDGICFGSFNQVQKISPAAIDAWARILSTTPNSRLLLKAFGFGEAAQRERILAAFASEGISAERISIRAAQADRRDHFALYNEVDIVLDTFPYNGATTTCEALWMGVPVLTLAGETHASRMGASILGAVGLNELVCVTAEDYVAAAGALAANPKRLQAYHKGLRAAVESSSLRKEREFTRSFELTLRGALQREHERLRRTATQLPTMDEKTQ